MGDYYKIKKILLILLIVSVIFRIINQTKVFAANVVDVSPVYTDGNYTVITDNNFMIMRENNLDVQNNFINTLRRLYDDPSYSSTVKSNVVSVASDVYFYMCRGTSTFIYFNTTGNNSYAYCYYVIYNSSLSNVTYSNAYCRGYELIDVPFVNVTLPSGGKKFVQVGTETAAQNVITSGTYTLPLVEIGAYHSNWISLFEHLGILKSSEDYNNALNNIVGSVDELEGYAYSSSYYAGETSEIVGNTYDFIVDDDIDNYNSLGISQPSVTSQIDLTSVFDEVEILLTDEDYTSKAFTFSLPGNRNFNFSLNPNILETNLTRVGGSGIIEIIHACWYIALYGWYIFAYLRIFSKLISGDWLHLVGGTSPTNKLVKISVGSITGGGY